MRLVLLASLLWLPPISLLRLEVQAVVVSTVSVGMLPWRQTLDLRPGKQSLTTVPAPWPWAPR